MIEIKELNSDEVCCCTCCQCEPSSKRLFQIRIGKSERQTITIRLCEDCVMDFTGKMYLQYNKIGCKQVER